MLAYAWFGLVSFSWSITLPDVCTVSTGVALSEQGQRLDNVTSQLSQPYAFPQESVEHLFGIEGLTSQG
jgi:hypothetical protein